MFEFLKWLQELNQECTGHPNKICYSENNIPYRFACENITSCTYFTAKNKIKTSIPYQGTKSGTFTEN